MKCVKCKSSQIYTELTEHINKITVAYCLPCWQEWLMEFRGEES